MTFWRGRGLSGKKSRHRSGILLLEVIATMVVLSVGLVMVTRSFSTSLRAARAVQNYFYAAVRIENLIWEIEDSSVGEGEELAGEGTDQDSYGEFQWYVRRSELATPGLSEADVSVEWKETRRTEGMNIKTLYYVPPVKKEEEEE